MLKEDYSYGENLMWLSMSNAKFISFNFILFVMRIVFLSQFPDLLYQRVVYTCRLAYRLGLLVELLGNPILAQLSLTVTIVDCQPMFFI